MIEKQDIQEQKDQDVQFGFEIEELPPFETAMLQGCGDF